MTTIATDRRIGRFSLHPSVLVQLELKQARQLMRPFIVLEATPVEKDDQGVPMVVRYVAYSDLFDQVEPGAPVPGYDVRVTRNRNGVQVIAARLPERSALERMRNAVETAHDDAVVSPEEPGKRERMGPSGAGVVGGVVDDAGVRVGR